MTHVFDGEPDGRQADEHIPVSRFRPRYRQLSEEEKKLHDDIKAKAAEMEALFEAARSLRFPDVTLGVDVQQDGLALKPGGEFNMQLCTFDPAVEYFNDGMKSLELAVMWTVKGLTA